MEENLKIRPILEQMEVGDFAAFDIAKLKSVRTQCSELGVILNRQYSTRTNREERKIYVVRKS